MTAVPIPGGIDLSGNKRRRRREAWIRRVFFAAALSSVVISGAIVLSLIGEAFSFLSDVDLSTLWSSGWYPRRGSFDVKTLFVGSLIVTGIAMAIATPLGLGAAIYLSEYAKPGARKVLKPILEILAGIPSIVIAFFALRVIGPDFVQSINPEAPVTTLLAAGIGVGILVIPLVASITEDALRAVPRSLREASYGMGAKKATTSLRVVFPAAISGVVASIILAASRALGETMVVALAAGGSGGSQFTTDPFSEGQTITAAMIAVAQGTDQVAGGGGGQAELAYQSLFFLGLLLFLFTMGLNFIGDRFVRRVREAY
ncbi:MAG: phosphate ABC transporter permease subunit PstC [Actinomycetota bacterium]|nr:phosphate ABC transporter permease subunit PstC [Actinomycetota bacterium]